MLNGISKILKDDKYFLVGLVLLVTLLYSFFPSKRSVTVNSIAINFMYTCVAVWLLRESILYIHRKLPAHLSLLGKLFIPLAISIVAFTIIQSLILLILEPLLSQRTPNSTQHWFTYIMGGLLVVIANIFYTFIHWKNQTEKETDNPTLASASTNHFLSGTLQGKQVNIPAKSIVHFWIVNTITKANDLNHNYVIQGSLADIENLLDTSDYFRANRQHIISRHIVGKVTYLSNKNASIELTTTGESIIVSRYNTPKFRKWLRASTDTK